MGIQTKFTRNICHRHAANTIKFITSSGESAEVCVITADKYNLFKLASEVEATKSPEAEKKFIEVVRFIDYLDSYLV